jgi:hypothetical protein
MRQIAGLVARYFPNSLLRRLTEQRHAQGMRWKDAAAIVRLALCGLMAGCKGTQDVEDLSEAMPRCVRKMIGIPRRMPDTTLRGFLCTLDVGELTELLAVVGYDAWRRKALRHNRLLPWGVLTLDGKWSAIRDIGQSKKGQNEFLQVHHDDSDEPTHGVVRTITATLMSGQGRPILGATPVPGDSNEVGHFQKAFGDMVRMYGRLFHVVMYDAGGASHDNFKAVLAAGKHAVFQIANPKWVMYQTIEFLFRDRPADVVDEEVVSSKKRVVRHLTVLPVKPTPHKNQSIWPEVKAVLKVYSETFENGERTGTKTRYYVTSLASDALAPILYLQMVIWRWGVESCHQILDTAFAEDKRPWITSDAQGTLVVMLLRRVAYTVMTLFRSVSQRSEDKRVMSWPKLMERFKDVLKWACPEIVEGFRPRTFAIPPALA